VIRVTWLSPDARKTLVESLTAANLAVVCQIHTAGGYFNNNEGNDYVYCGSYSVQDHKQSLHDTLIECASIIDEVDQRCSSKNGGGEGGSFVNIHSGVDAWTMEETMDFLTFASNLVSQYESKFQITFETHRQRLFHSPYSTRDIFAALQANGITNILLNADLSHWYVVSERVYDTTEARDKTWWPNLLETIVAPHCGFIHCRFGFAEGPQMADPSIPSCQAEVKRQIEYWKVLWRYQVYQQQRLECWGEPEHGPPPYMPVHPATGEPVASLPASVAWAKQQMEQAFAEVVAEGAQGEQKNSE
jgi:hypothetical protein